MSDFIHVLENYHYSPSQGIFCWAKVHPYARGIVVGGRPKSLSKRGYAVLSFKGKNYLAHRVAWLAYYGAWPEQDIDHINGDKLDNRISNLRLATDSQNLANSKIHKNNKSGFKGVSPFENKFRAQIKKDGKVIYLGLFVTAKEAHAAYLLAAKELHGEFARAA